MTHPLTQGLSQLLADTHTLYLNTHNFHWNVTGPLFPSLHALFMTQYTELWNATDPIAERIRALGARAPGSYRQFQQLTVIAEAPSEPLKALDMVRHLLAGHQLLIQSLGELLALAEHTPDAATADLLTQRLDAHQKTAWMLRALLED
ncbi:Dps family protein [Inhella gelatinilytica]|uniref:DNA starvation/stationary phase protection protein n=1 Tax=Inhella gelatinilytica TaxID=2795030 RepID=A0A931IST8_9BURK|nr:DNA starvation/stationary phase protection protein [Inhella gelatinilytica]MBH9552067.1 DNA starvation/stationary phase protection protein [Inhella gelatinilytica]